MKSKSLSRFRIWLILRSADWLVFRERVKRYFRWLKYGLPKKIWAWKLKRKKMGRSRKSI